MTAPSSATAASVTVLPIVPPAPHWSAWWPLLLGPIGMAWSAMTVLADAPVLQAKPVHEVGAIVLTALAALLCVTRAICGRERFYILLAAVACTVLLREIHWDWTTKFVYASLASIAVWAWFWRDSVTPWLRHRHATRIWLIAAAITYVLSQMIARRVLQRLVPGDTVIYRFIDGVYGDMEEVVENIAHVQLLVTVTIGSWVRAVIH
ncbi:MAG: hypothetical protein HRU76_15060 [Phycisphaeraceae bacterium]|nr:hypothetical protein [Phycisphaerales bacterium]QOJ18822.1 MAG: hypothetical protein HRU76_15060 [Phycisphaeraceae bacterium]